MSSGLPKISIITPSYNDCHYLERTILSVLSQGYPNLEYIIIDGGSTDGSVDIIKKYADKLAWWVSEPDGGMYHALKKGFEKSTGDIMGWINSDDLLHTKSLFTVGQVFGDHEEIQWLQGTPNVVDEDDRVVVVLPADDVDKLFFYKKKHIDNHKYIQQESTYWRRSLWDKVGAHISTDYKYAGDFELWIRFFQHAKLYNIDAFTGAFRLSRAGQASVENYPAYLEETLSVLKRYPLTEEEEKQIKAMRLLNKSEDFLHKIKGWFLSKKEPDITYVENHKLYFNGETQKFELRK